MKDNSSKDEVSLSNTSNIPLIDKATDKLTPPRDSLNSSRNRDDVNLDAERQATIQEQERIAREGSRLLDVLQRNSTLPISVSTVQIVGIRQTRPSFVKSVTEPLYNPTEPRQTLSTIIQDTSTIANKLHSFNIFDPNKTQVSFDRAKSPLAGENDVDITIHLQEKKRFAAQTSTWAGDGEAIVQTSARAENLFGGAERVEGIFEAGTRTKNYWQVKFETPIAAKPDLWGEIGVFGMSRDQKFFASHELLQRGAHLKLKTLSNLGVHDFTLSTILRQVTSLDQKASPSIIASAGDTIKTSLSHTIVHDKRDDITLPTQGYFVKSMQEFAGLGAGDVRFFKATIDAQYAKTFPQFSPRTHFLWNTRGGILWSLEKNATTRITDRFHLGGPTDVRGFRHFGIGPKDGNDSVGGEAFVAYSGSVMFPVPNAPPSWPLRFQAFVNAGALLPLDQRNVGQTLSELWRRPSVGVGFGVVYRAPIGRVELNFGVPVTVRQGDWSRKGFQFGFGLEFM